MFALLLLGCNPVAADGDLDGIYDGSEDACGSDPLNVDEGCNSCGWPHNDPGNLVSTGSDEGDVIANLALIDQCEEPVDLWDFAREYHILFLTAAW